MAATVDVWRGPRVNIAEIGTTLLLLLTGLAIIVSGHGQAPNTVAANEPNSNLHPTYVLTGEINSAVLDILPQRLINTAKISGIGGGEARVISNYPHEETVLPGQIAGGAKDNGQLWMSIENNSEVNFARYAENQQPVVILEGKNLRFGEISGYDLKRQQVYVKINGDPEKSRWVPASDIMVKIHIENGRPIVEYAEPRFDVPITAAVPEQTMRNEANRLISSEYIWADSRIEKNPRLQKLLQEAKPAVDLMNNIQRKVMKPTDFYDQKYHLFSNDRLMTNVVFIETPNQTGGGESALFDFYGNPDRPMKLMGAYYTANIDRIEASTSGAVFLSNYLHEGYGHPLQALSIDYTNCAYGRDCKNTDPLGIVHSSMGWSEEAGRQLFKIDWLYPDPQLIFATNRIARVSSREQALERMLRIGNGKFTEIPEAEKLYKKGALPGDPSWKNLWSGKLKLTDKETGELLNPLRKTLDEMFGIPFSAYYYVK